MKQTLKRLPYYLFFIVLLSGILVAMSGAKADPPPGTPPLNAIAFYMGGYFIPWTIAALICEAIYRFFRHFHRKAQLSIDNSPTKDLIVPETNRLDRE